MKSLYVKTISFFLPFVLSACSTINQYIVTPTLTPEPTARPTSMLLPTITSTPTLEEAINEFPVGCVLEEDIIFQTSNDHFNLYLAKWSCFSRTNYQVITGGISYPDDTLSKPFYYKFIFGGQRIILYDESMDGINQNERHIVPGQIQA